MSITFTTKHHTPQVFMLSEAGMDYCLKSGVFNALGSGSDFNKEWWKETCAFEAYMAKYFPQHYLFISDQVSQSKSFTIWHNRQLPFAELCRHAFGYLAEFHRDAAVIIASPFGLEMPSGSIAITLRGIWVEQDIVFWLLTNRDQLGALVSELLEYQHTGESVNVCHAVNWLDLTTAKHLRPTAFWEMFYSGGGIPIIAETEPEASDTYNIGSEITDRLATRFSSVSETEEQEVYVSWALGRRKVIKIECERDVCSRQFIQDAFSIVTEYDEDWSIRFSVYERLTKENSYLGSFLVGPDNRFILECGQRPGV